MMQHHIERTTVSAFSAQSSGAVTRVIDWFVPERVFEGQHDVRWRARLLVGGALGITATLAVLVLLRLLFSEGRETLWMMMGGLVLSVATPFVLRVTGSLKLAGLVAPGTALLLLPIGAWANGGLHSLAAYWFPAWPLIVVVALGPIAGLTTATLLIAEIGGLYVIEASGLAHPPAPDPAQYRGFFAMGASAFVAFTGFIAWLYESSRERALQALRASEERYEVAVRGARDALWDWDLEHDDLFVSSQFLHLLDYDDASRAMATPAAALALVHPDDRPLVSSVIRQVLTAGAPFGVECRMRTRDGAWRWFDIRGDALRSAGGRVTRMAGSARDIHRAKVAELELEMRAKALERSNADLERFAYVVSHDLKAPVRTVSSYAQLVWKRFHGQLGDDGERLLQPLVEGPLRMQAMIDGLLAYARIGKEPVPLELVALDDVLETVLQNLSGAIGETGAKVTRTPLPSVYGNRLALVQVFQNLIDNALKFRAARTPEVRIAAERSGDTCQIVVEDNGIGMASEHLDRIFQLFQRLHSRDKYPGTGIGLAICQRIVEHHRGTLTVTSEPDRGSRFVVALPVKGI